MRVELGAEGAAQEDDPAHQILRPADAAGDEVAVPAGVLGERVEREVGAVQQRLLVHRPEQRVVDHDRRPVALRLPEPVGDRRHARRSTRPLVGLAGVSSMISPTRPCARAASAASPIRAGSVPSVKPTALMPKGASWLRISVSVPP